MKGLKYTTVLQVPNSKDSKLLRELARIEPKLAKLTKYSTKLVEKSGIPLVRLFSRTFDEGTCHWKDCPACAYPDKRGSKCRQNNIVYESVCLVCEKEVGEGTRQSSKLGKYIGETSRCLAERSREHVQLYRNADERSFMLKHWALEHSESTDQPSFKFKVLKSFKDPLSRIITEAVLIDRYSTMNSKSEWGGAQACKVSDRA